MQTIGTIAVSQKSVTVAASKVPAATFYFWLIKVLTTGLGETTSDVLLHHCKPRSAAILAVGAAFAAALAVQMLSGRFHAARYWLTVVLVAVFGTMVADIIDFSWHAPLVATTAICSGLLAAVLWAWWKTEGTLSIHSIFNRRREVFYWATVFITFVLGTAAGDWTASTLHVGYLGSGVLFFALILLPPLACRTAMANGVLCFWAAYILTRPLGASFADWMSEAQTRGGLGLGPGKVSLIWAIAIAALVAWITVRRGKASDPPDREGHVSL